MVAREDRLVKSRVHFANIAGQQLRQQFGALDQRGRILAGPDEGIDDQAADLRRVKIGKACSPQRSRRLAEETGLPVLVAEDPLTCVARGCGMALERMDQLGSIFTSE